MSATDITDLTAAEQHIIRHAAAMGGWLSASYFVGDYKQPLGHLMCDGLMFGDITNRGVRRYVLSDAGWAAASAFTDEGWSE